MDDVGGILSKLARNKRGSVAILFGLSIPLALGFAGVAIDFSRAEAVKQAAQGALDAAVLATARQSFTDEDAVDTSVKSYFAAQHANKHDSVTTRVEGHRESGRTIRGEARLSVPTTIMKIFGFSSIPLSLRSKASRSLGNVEVALVLDSTASMEGSKLNNLKSASRELVDTLFDTPDASGKVKISLVPFGQYVNVGMDNRDASWMNVPPDSVSTSYQCWDTWPGSVSSNCRTERVNTTRDGMPYSYDAEVCDWSSVPPVNVCQNVTTNMVWNGCAGSRTNPLNIRDAEYSSRIPGIQNVSCPSPLKPLSDQRNQVKDSISAMFAQGDTYIPAGMVWGWRTLSNRAPFTQSADDPGTASAPPRKYIVLMTDGFNTRSPRYPEGDNEGWDPTAANQLTREVCDNIKGDTQSKIDIFTIAFQVNDESVKDILRYCATPGGAFFDAIDTSRLFQAFRDVGTGLAIARITQ